MGTFIFLLFLFFIIIPVCRVAWRAWQLQRQWRRATENLRNGFAEGSSSKNAKPKPEPKKKKIDPAVGEYVAFEEIHSETSQYTSTDGSSTTVHIESQVEDAIWEEIPQKEK